MKYSQAEIQGLIDGLLPMLKDTSEIVSYKTTVHSGKELLDMGCKTLTNGVPVLIGKTYQIKTPIRRLVDHGKKIEKIIKDARTRDQVQNDLALYLAKNGKSLEAIKARD